MREPIIFFLVVVSFFLLVKIFKYIIHGIPDVLFFCAVLYASTTFRDNNSTAHLRHSRYFSLKFRAY